MESKLIALLFMLIGAITANEGKRVAILPFTAKGQFDPLYAEVAQDNFTTELIKGNLYKVVERSQLDKAMKELKFQSGSDFDESSAVEIGKLAGAEVVAIGIITALKNQIVVNIRGINVKTGIAEFAERDFIKSQEEVLTAVEKIAKKLSSGSESNTWKFSNQSSTQSSNVDFSIADEYGNVPLTHSEKKFLVKFFQEKWGIDVRDTYNVQDMYNKYLGAGIAMATIGGMVSLAGFLMTVIGFVSWNTDEYPKRPNRSDYYYTSDYDKAYEKFAKERGEWEDRNPSEFAVGIVGLPILLVVGLPLIAMSSYPFVIADTTKTIYRKMTGNRSFRVSPSFSSVYDSKQKQERMQIAFGMQF